MTLERRVRDFGYWTEDRTKGRSGLGTAHSPAAVRPPLVVGELVDVGAFTLHHGVCWRGRCARGLLPVVGCAQLTPAL